MHSRHSRQTHKKVDWVDIIVQDHHRQKNHLPEERRFFAKAVHAHWYLNIVFPEYLNRTRKNNSAAMILGEIVLIFLPGYGIIKTGRLSVQP